MPRHMSCGEITRALGCADVSGVVRALLQLLLPARRPVRDESGAGSRKSLSSFAPGAARRAVQLAHRPCRSAVGVATVSRGNGAPICTGCARAIGATLTWGLAA